MKLDGAYIYVVYIYSHDITVFLGAVEFLFFNAFVDYY